MTTEKRKNNQSIYLGVSILIFVLLSPVALTILLSEPTAYKPSVQVASFPWFDSCEHFPKCDKTKCIYNNEEDSCTNVCRFNKECKSGGKCTYSIEKRACIVKNSLSCQSTKLCNTAGRCYFNPKTGNCEAESLEKCQDSHLCRYKGLCGLQNGSCITTQTGCEKTEQCKDEGRCALYKGRCVTSPKGCAQSLYCNYFGKCNTFDLDKCQAMTEEDCRLSYRCTNFGACTPLKGKCVATSTLDCKKASACKERGTCTLDIGSNKCRAGSDAECAGSMVCKAVGACTASKEGVCVAAKTEDCRKSDNCIFNGFCTAGKEKLCLPRSIKWCEKSQTCRGKKGCTLYWVYMYKEGLKKLRCADINNNWSGFYKLIPVKNPRQPFYPPKSPAEKK